MDAFEYDVAAKEQCFLSLHNGLNSDQLRVYNAIWDAYVTNSSDLFFINGSGGTGKTYLWKTIISKFRSERKIILSVASSGITSLLLPGGRTAHSRFKIPIELSESSSYNINYDSELAELIRQSSLIIWDEAPMMHRYGFEAVDRNFKDLLKRCTNFSIDKSFKGKLCILGGAFKQILPVVNEGRREAIVDACLHKSTLWNQCNIMHLRQNMRLTSRDDTSNSTEELQRFTYWLNLVGEGKSPTLRVENGQESDWIEIPPRLLLHDSQHPLKQLISHTYPDFTFRCHDLNYLSERAILAPKNEDVDELNFMLLSMLSGEVQQYYSADTACPVEGRQIEQNLRLPELLNSLKISDFPNHCLDLKKGTPIILLKNLNQSIGLCNGTRLIVSKMGEKIIEARIISGSHIGDEALIPRVYLQ